MLYIRCLFLLLLLADWAWDTHFGRNCLSSPMASSQVTPWQAVGSAEPNQHLKPFHTWWICPVLFEGPICLSESAFAFLAANAPCRYHISLTYLFMSLQR